MTTATVRFRSVKAARLRSRILYHVLMTLVSLFMLYPLLWMLSSSFKPNNEIFATAGSLIPKTFTLEHYPNGWRGFAGISFATFFSNSLFIAGFNSVATMVSSAIVAYGFARLHFPGRNLWFTCMILTMMLPGQVMQIPRFVLFKELNWVGSYLPMTVPSLFAGGFNVFLIMQFVRGVPRDMDEAARIDGCNWYQIFLYLQYILDWSRKIQNEDGTLFESGWWISLQSLDFRQGSNVLFFLYECTHDAHMLELIRYMAEDLYQHYPRNADGGFWHGHTFPGQMWLDGLYMAGPILAHYAAVAGLPAYMDLAIQQIFIMHRHMRDEKSGLLYHGWDASHQARWADPVTGCSAEIWCRACGWFVLAIADMLDYIPLNHPRRADIIRLQQGMIQAVVAQQSEEGRWYEVVDKWQQQGNWPENSGTCLFIYAICKGIRQGYIPPELFACAQRAYQRLIETLPPAEEGNFILGDVCVGTSIDAGTYEHYISRKRISNDLHGLGAFLLMIGEYAQMESRAP